MKKYTILALAISVISSSAYAIMPGKFQPKAAMDACSGKTEGADCSYTGLNNASLSGTCTKSSVSLPGAETLMVCTPKAAATQGNEPVAAPQGNEPVASPQGNQPSLN